MRVYQITSKFFCAGLVISGGRVVEAAPIIHYTKGWGLNRLKYYIKRRKWKVKFVCQEKKNV